MDLLAVEVGHHDAYYDLSADNISNHDEEELAAGLYPAVEEEDRPHGCEQLVLEVVPVH